jgi:uncharacterized protein YlzI (FlbEa/FlbD family)
MTSKNYIGYTVEDLVHDQGFISAVQNIKTEEEWEQFLQLHTGSKNNIIRARKIILLFKVNEGTLPDEKKYKLWKNISGFNLKNRRNYRIHSLGSLLYLNSLQNKNQYHFADSQDDLKTEKPLLVLSNGNKVELGKDESVITVLKGQDAIQVNNDSIVENLSSENKNTKEVKFNEVIIPYGKKSKLILSDGTKVWLNAGSRFAFPQKFEGKEREVFLDGEAYLEVAKNHKQPFILSTNSINIEVAGTKFNVSAYGSDDFNEAVLLEGSINIFGKNKLFNDKISMVPNQKATYSKTSSSIVLSQEPTPEIYIAWIEGWYLFSNEDIEEVLKKVERFYNVACHYDKEIISETLPVSGKLDLKDSLPDVMDVLSGVAKFEYRISGDDVIIENN